MTTAFHVRLSPNHVAALRQAATQAYPRECCGLLVGEGDTLITVTEVVPTANIAVNPGQAFEIDPQVQFDVHRRVRGSGQRVVGHYHSHPEGPAQPSPRDLVMAHDPEAVWVLLTPDDSPRAFRHPLGATGFVEMPVTISEQEARSP